ncbi:MAG: pyrimidine-nucleoside phosphorylase [Firmicutes bacterium]|nr:pyrimidine-nucleoside phosphorylase [Bacillota bacterium]
MRAYDLIMKKRNGNPLTTAEIQFLISEYTKGNIADYQMAAFCMAVYFQGMDYRETADFTMAMANSGRWYDLSKIKGKIIDKHSTGGVGDTTTLIVTPLVASCGVPVAKMSGRGLGHTGGTIDKLESIPGFNTEVSPEDFIDQVNQINICIMSQSDFTAPADKKLYSLRDVTATVDSIPLIASSIMSKKLAAGAHGFVLDVKTGNGAFMRQLDEAVELAKTMTAIGKQVGKPTTALITNMDQPLGFMIGNSLEVKEAIKTLAGSGPQDLTELCLLLGAEMLVLADYTANVNEAYKLLKKKLKSKEGLVKLAEFVAYQGGNPKVIDEPSLLPQAEFKTVVKSQKSGYVSSIDTLKIGNIAMSLGAGRQTKTDIIDVSVGIELKRKVGDYTAFEQPLAVIHSNKPIKLEGNALLECYKINPSPPLKQKLIYKKITTLDV